MSPSKAKRARRQLRRAVKIDWAQLGQKIAARADLSIAEWCAKHNLSKPTFVNYRRQGIGPTETVANGRVTIAAAADDEWVARHARPTRGRPRVAREDEAATAP